MRFSGEASQCAGGREITLSCIAGAVALEDKGFNPRLLKIERIKMDLLGVNSGGRQ